MTTTTRILVADDHPVVRAGIVGLLETVSDFTVVGEAVSGEEAVELAAEQQPDVVLMDLRMPGIGGVEATRRLVTALPSTHVLIFTTYEEDDQILAAIEAGAAGYLVKAAPADELIAGVRAVSARQMVLAPSIAALLVERARGEGAREDQAAAVDRPRLTPRETEILRLVAQGLSNPAIAEHLCIGESTVKTHLLHVFEKLEVADRTRAVTRAMELDLL